MNPVLGLILTACALSAGAFTWASTVPAAQATQQYRCERGRNVIALERPTFVRLMVAGRSYDLTWVNTSTARGHGLIWHVSNGSAALTRVSSGFALASGCARVATQL